MKKILLLSSVFLSLYVLVFFISCAAQTLVDGDTALPAKGKEDLSIALDPDLGTQMVASAPGLYRNTINGFILQNSNSEFDGEFKGDVCGFVVGKESLYAIAIRLEDGAHVFQIDPQTGQQMATFKIFIPHPDYPSPHLDLEQFPLPCEGSYAEADDGTEHLYLTQNQGGDILKYDVNLTTHLVEGPTSTEDSEALAHSTDQKVPATL